MLSKCIESVLNQTYPDFEVLLIDDGSTDNSAEICDRYSQLDERIKCFHKKNGGVCSARNLGLENASGEYVTFCDSDDWVVPDYLEKLYPHNNEDFIGCSFFGHDKFDSVLKDSCDLQEILQYNLTSFAFASAWCKLYKRGVIEANHIRFREEISMGEDIVFVLDFLNCKLSSIKTISDKLYFYYNNVESPVVSLSHRIVPLDLSFQLVEILYNSFKNISTIYHFDCEDAKNEYLCSQLCNILFTLKSSESSFLEKMRGVRRIIINRYLKTLFVNKNYWNNHKSSSEAKNLLRNMILGVLRIYYFLESPFARNI